MSNMNLTEELDNIEVAQPVVENVEVKKSEVKEKKPVVDKNVTYIDLQNSDDRKTVMQLMSQGTILKTDKDRAFIVAEQQGEAYSKGKLPVHTIMCDEIIHVTVRNYYLDLELMPAGGRTLVNKIIWVYHKGYRIHSMITSDQLTYLLKNKFITDKQVFYAHNDMSNGSSYFLGTDANEPTAEKIAGMKAQNLKNFNKIGLLQETEDTVVEPIIEPVIEEVVKEIVEEVIEEVATDISDDLDLDLDLDLDNI